MLYNVFMINDNTEYNNAVDKIIQKTCGLSIKEQLDAGEFQGLPLNFELVMDFYPEVYSIRDDE